MFRLERKPRIQYNYQWGMHMFRINSGDVTLDLLNEWCIFMDNHNRPRQ